MPRTFPELPVPTPDSSADRDPLDRLAEEFVARYRGGERPSLTEYAERLPDRAAEIRELFPALIELEQRKPASDELTGAYAAEPAPALGRLAGFRVLREVGRGGMGVVYEAVQEALGRHVALKVLPASATSDPRRAERFRREARAAARLHHTNIVPVFQTGEADGVHFYAMQFIIGSGLDQVVVELRKLREAKAAGTATPLVPREATATHAKAVAHSLATAHFEPQAIPETLTFAPAPEAATVSAPDTPAAAVPGAPPPVATQLSATESAFSSGTGRRYWDAVARLGMQATSALAHAHSQGVLHRDIKPSNLMLDAHGTLWVTDFGLAKIAEDEDLTGTGDILGTLRYMAPERFEGRCDARADIYALGLTLYELLTLRSAFDETGREKLIAQVMRGQPVKPSQVNPRIPRDLETIVLKAIAREPEARYQTAAEMTEDLECFVQDRPIRARRASTVEKLVRWSRRNPVVAGLTAALGAVLIAVAVASTVTALSYRKLAEKEVKARGDAEDKERKIADDLEKQNHANALFESGFGRIVRQEWPQALADYTRATELKPENSQVWSDRGVLFLRLGLVNEAAADFAKLFEVRQPDEPAWWHFHAALRLHVGDREGYRAVCRVVRRHFPEASSPEVAQAVVRVCTLAPDGCDDPLELVRYVEHAATRFPMEPFGELRVAALYRAGLYSDVVVATNPTNPNVAAERTQRPAVLCFRAMSLARLNNATTAQASFATARDKLDATASVLSLQSFGPDANQRFVGTFPKPEKLAGLADWIVDDLLWREATGNTVPVLGPHPLPLFIRARGCAALNWWDRADAAIAEAVRICFEDPKNLRIPEVALVERARQNAARGRWPEVATDFAKAQTVARADSPPTTQITDLYTSFGRHEEAREHLSAAIARESEGSPVGRAIILSLRLERGRTNARLGDWNAAAADLGATMSAPEWNPSRLGPVTTIGGGLSGSYFPPGAGPMGAQLSDSYFPVWYVRAGAGNARSFNPRREVREAIARHDEVYSRVIVAYPRDTELRQTRGRFLASAKQWDEARDFYLDWVANAPKLLPDGVGVLPGQDPAEANREAVLALFVADVVQWDQLFEPLVAKYGTSAMLWTARYQWHLRAGDVEKAVDVIVRMLPPIPDPAKPEARPSGVYSMVVANEDVFRAVVARRPTDSDLWMARFRGPQSNLPYNSDREKVERAAVEVIKRCRQEPFWVATAATALAASAKPERALGLCAEAVLACPDDADVQMAYCVLNARLKKWREAATAFDVAVKSKAPPGTGRLTAYDAYQRLPNDEELFAEVSQRRPNDVELWRARGRQLSGMGKNPVPALLRATEIDKRNSGVWIELARAYTSRQQWKEAAGAFNELLALVPPVPYTAADSGAYAEIVARGVASPQSRQLITTLMELRPDDVRLRLDYSRVLCRWAMNDTTRAEATRALDELVRVAPKEPLALLDRGRFRLASKDAAGAAADFAAAGKLLPRKFFENASWPTLEPMFFEIANNPALFTAYTALCPDDAFPWHFRSWVRRNPLHPDHATWEADITRAIELQPDEPRHQFARHNFYLELGLWDKAGADSAAGLKLAGTFPRSFLWVEAGCAYAAAGDLKRYRVLCRRMAESWGAPELPGERQQLVMTQLLLPHPEADPKKMLAHALEALKAEPNPWWNTFAVALAHCRAGQPGAAVPLVQGYFKKFERMEVQDRIALEFVLVVALARDGNTADATSVFRAACERMDSMQFVNGKRKLLSPGHVWALSVALRREADALLNNTIPPPRPVGEKPK